MNKNHFWQCSYCLTIGVTDSTLISPKCGICTQDVNYLGYAGPDGKKLLRNEDRCPCDGRCTGATGPNCTCQCGGANHGSGRLVTVTIEAGKVPIINLNDDQGLARANEYKALRLKARDILRPLQDKYNNKIRIDYPVFVAFVRAKEEIKAIHALTTHKTRIKKLTKLIEELESICYAK